MPEQRGGPAHVGEQRQRRGELERGLHLRHVSARAPFSLSRASVDCARDQARGSCARRPVPGGRGSVTTLGGDAMVSDPRALAGSATAQEAAELLVRPEVRAVLVVDEGRLPGLVTAAGLVEKVVAAGRDPRETPLGEIADDAVLTVE